MRQRIIVVGGLAAGPSAASKAKRVNPDAEVLLFEQGEHVSYAICEIPYYLGGMVHDRDLLLPFDSAKLEQTRGIQVKTGHIVEEVFPTKKKIVVRDLGREKVAEYSYDKLILALGSKVRRLSKINTNGKNVFKLKSFSDGMAIHQFVEEKKPGHCVIVGGGYVGMEMCDALVSRKINVTLLHPESLPMSGLEGETRKAVLEELTNRGVEFRPSEPATEFVADSEGNVVEVRTARGTYSSDMVIISIGVEPNSELASRAGIRLGKHGGILTDERQLTSDDSIFAAGDCCEIKNLVTRKWMYIPLATYASRQGRVAGENAAGGRVFFKGAIRAIAVKVFSLEVAQVGISLDEALAAGFDALKVSITSDSKISYYPGNERISIVGIADRGSKRLVGANVFGGQGSVLRANWLGLAVQQGMSVDDLVHSDLIYSPPFSPLWDPVLLLVGQLQKAMSRRSF
jgi:NADPH-dependent 2,4-dienoyl-CoA reductase/sulfur reductase-like enzyme